MLKDQIKADTIAAMKSGDQQVTGVLRMASSAMNAKKTEKRYALAKEKPDLSEEELAKLSELTEEEMIGVLASEVKKRKDAIALYVEGGREELADTEKQEIAILQKYLPEQLSAEDIKKLVQEAIAVTGAASIKDMGKVMAELSPKIKGKADGGEVSKIVKELLPS